MQLDHLRKLASSIGNVTAEYMLEIEEFRNETEEVFFCWRHKENDEWNIIVELTKDGQLIHFYIDEQGKTNETIKLPEEKLEELALSFVTKHYPDADVVFTFEEWKKLKNGSYRLTYVQKALELPLPHTGFYLTITPAGRITDFRYDGQARKIIEPKSIASEALMKEKMMKQVTMNLEIIEFSKELYVDGDDSYKLVYEPELVTYRYAADGSEITHDDFDEEDDEHVEKTERLVRPDISADVDTLLGFDENSFSKIREQDLGTEIGTVWRLNDADIKADQDDLSLEAFFARRNDGTLKMRHHRETGLLLGSFSFLERNGTLNLSFDECKKLAYQLLFQLYPNADKYFHYVAKNHDDDDESNPLYHYEFRLCINDFPVRFGAARISVNRTTGTIDHYMGPDIKVNELNDINTTPAITEAEAISTYINYTRPKLEWQLEYKDNEPAYYELIYIEEFKTERGNGAYVDAHTGQVIVRKF